MYLCDFQIQALIAQFFVMFLTVDFNTIAKCICSSRTDSSNKLLVRVHIQLNSSQTNSTTTQFVGHVCKGRNTTAATTTTAATDGVNDTNTTTASNDLSTSGNEYFSFILSKMLNRNYSNEFNN